MKLFLTRIVAALLLPCLSAAPCFASGSLGVEARPSLTPNPPVEESFEKQAIIQPSAESQKPIYPKVAAEVVADYEQLPGATSEKTSPIFNPDIGPNIIYGEILWGLKGQRAPAWLIRITLDDRNLKQPAMVVTIREKNGGQSEYVEGGLFPQDLYLRVEGMTIKEAKQIFKIVCRTGWMNIFQQDKEPTNRVVEVRAAKPAALSKKELLENSLFMVGQRVKFIRNGRWGVSGGQAHVKSVTIHPVSHTVQVTVEKTVGGSEITCQEKDLKIFKEAPEVEMALEKLYAVKAHYWPAPKKAHPEEAAARYLRRKIKPTLEDLKLTPEQTRAVDRVLRNSVRKNDRDGSWILWHPGWKLPVPEPKPRPIPVPEKPVDDFIKALKSSTLIYDSILGQWTAIAGHLITAILQKDPSYVVRAMRMGLHSKERLRPYENRLLMTNLTNEFADQMDEAISGEQHERKKEYLNVFNEIRRLAAAA